MDIDYIRSLVEEKREEMAANMLALSAIPSVNPQFGGPGEYKRCAWILSVLERHGISYELFDVPDARTEEGVRRNIIVRLPGRTPEKTLWFISHTDTVAPGDLNAWDTDPYMPTQKGDRIYGLGVEDNSQAVITTLEVLLILVEQKIVPALTCGFVFVADEETGSNYGLKAMVEAGFFKPGDEAIVPDYGSKDGRFVEIAEKSGCRTKFTVIGKQAHGAMPHMGINAFSVSCRLATALEDTLKSVFCDVDDMFDPPYSTFEPTQCFPTVESHNIIPGEFGFYFDIRLLPRHTPDMVVEVVKKVVREFEEKYHVQIKMETKKKYAPEPTAKDSTVVRNLLAVLKETGVEGFVGGVGGGTVAAHLRRIGIPAVAWSTLEELAHQLNEYIIVDNLEKDAVVHLGTILKYGTASKI